MTEKNHQNLSRRERQIMDIIYQLGQATATEVLERLPNAPTNSAVRTMLKLLEEKGLLKHKQEGVRHVFLPTVAREKARKSALKQLVDTFFDGSGTEAVAALLDLSNSKISRDELDRLSELIEEARKKGR